MNQSIRQKKDLYATRSAESKKQLRSRSWWELSTKCGGKQSKMRFQFNGDCEAGKGGM